MSFPLRFNPAAARDVESAYDWYEERQVGLGSEFVETVDNAASQISANPDAYPVIRSRIHRAVLRRFPYLLFYVIEAEEIVVLACMHASRDPERWPS